MEPGLSTEEQIREEYERRREAFYDHPAARAVPDIALYHWYHTVDLGNGLLTPGQYDYRESVKAFPFPEDMTGATLLEVGSATGFFSFEAERRGARVTSVELPSFHQLDRFPGQTQTRLLRRLAQMRTPDAALDTDPLVAMSSGQTYFYHLDGPFQFCYLQLGSKIERIYSTIYDLKHSPIAGRKFDYVLLGDVLVHLFNPVQALAAAAEFAGGKLVISQLMPEIETAHPVLQYVGGETLDEDDLCWFLPNLAFFRQFCRKLGFASVDEVGRNRGRLLPSGYAFDRSIILASR
jgi:tRNA (mo5U34)-methyltransferase